MHNSYTVPVSPLIIVAKTSCKNKNADRFVSVKSKFQQEVLFYIMGHYPKLILLALLLVIFDIHSRSSGAQENMVYATSARQTVAWTELIFQGSKFLSSITVKIQLSSADQVIGDLSTKRGTGFADCVTIGNDSKLLKVQSSATGVDSSQSKYEEKIWFNEKAIHPEKRIRLNSGDDPWVKSYCWEEKGVRRLKILPSKSSEKKYPSSKWTKRTKSFYDYPADAAGCATISDPSLILYMLSTLDLGRRQEPIEICVFGRKQLHRVTVEQEESSSLQVTFTVRSSSKEVSVEDTITPVVFSVTTETFSPGKDKPEAYSFLGLNKGIRIFMDAEKSLPVRITGTNNSIGDLVLDLKVHSK